MNRALTIIVVLCIAAFCVGLAGCATTQEPAIRVVEVKVPTILPCVSDRTPPPPTYPDDDASLLAAPSAAARYALIAAGRLLRIQRLAETEPAIEKCRMPSRQVDAGFSREPR